LEKMLGGLGDVTVEDLEAASGRSTRFRLEAPGHGLATSAVFEYREFYRRITGGWLRRQYLYEYRPQPSPSRRAHHDHPPLGVHAHCREAEMTRSAAHYADRPRLLEEMHEEFEGMYLATTPIDCGGLRPLP
jgi:hypothetical protein